MAFKHSRKIFLLEKHLANTKGLSLQHVTFEQEPYVDQRPTVLRATATDDADQLLNSSCNTKVTSLEA